MTRTKNLFFILFSAIIWGAFVQATPEQPLSIVEAACIIWRMKYKDICDLHKAVFPTKQNEEQKEASYIEQTTRKIEAMRKAIAEKIFGKTVVDRVLQTFHAASPCEQELLKDAIKGSYNEYIGFGVLGLLAAIIVFPIGFPLLMIHQWEHVNKIEAIRARLSEAA